MARPAEKPINHPVFARLFARLAANDEPRGQAALRRELLAGRSKRVIELGAGSGLNFAHYPSTVAAVVAVEPESYLRERAVAAARTAPVGVRVISGIAGQLPAGAGAFDAAAVSGCSVR